VSADWTIKPMLAIDTETTGIDTETDRIVEIAAVELDFDGNITSRWSTIIDPGIEIPLEASAVHGISTSKAVAEGMAPSKALQIAADLIHEAHRQMHPVVIYNAVFDLPLLINECHRNGVELFPFAAILDPLLMDKALDQYRKGSRKLVDVAKHYGVELSADDAHGAVADATAAGRIMRVLIRRYPQLGDQSLARLWLRQVRNQEAQRESFVDYMRTRKDPDFEKPSGWPIPVRG
jgi:DNA polymerase-3 subunit epsilon